jgi:hypothetical protein
VVLVALDSSWLRDEEARPFKSGHPARSRRSAI